MTEAEQAHNPGDGWRRKKDTERIPRVYIKVVANGTQAFWVPDVSDD